MIDRALQANIKKTSKSVLLLGPRQTGKSTLMQQLAPDLTINLARESEFLNFTANPDELEQRIAAIRPKTVFIDEIQRIPEMLNTVQALIDDAKQEKKALKFLLTGSSARKLRRGKANLLPGRILNYTLGPLTQYELGAGFNAKRAMALGTLPEPYLEPDISTATKLLEAYAGTYLTEEIQAEALSRNLQGFSRFIKVAASVSGQFLDFSKISQAAKVSRTSTIRYFEILEDTLLVYRLTPFTDTVTTADLIKHNKFYFFDPGVLNGLLNNFSVSLDRVGALFEHLLVSQLFATATALDKHVSIHTFRTRGGLEVDFILKIKDKIWAIEAKATSHPTTHDTNTLLAASKYLPAKTRYILTIPDGASRRLKNGIEIMALSKLLNELSH
ncbi:MAG: ATP-binding protein [Deltaproteobacteria bacterium]|nr:ATP-binding protein [Deltaproteobacteria bacterium]